MERKIINVTGKRQITIPLKFYEKLHFGKEVECVLADDGIVILPFSHMDDNFAMEILKNLQIKEIISKRLLVCYLAKQMK